MTEKEKTGMSILGLLRDAPSEASLCIIDVGQTMRHSLLIGETRDAAIAEHLKSALSAQESCVSTTIHKRPF
ncbi:hypothetical protein HMI48_05255 [Acidithiobacillus ferrooxidans]|uniref:hypothetical protein n=1 Tax=Acidithiobacillus ferrooxidans TaxID=920 RepID=UPI001C07C65C|nr:hypothetical protein [Acidithiobacillus ferrooxidans]MBU2773333.1 hypothetical protein [Acidithiobacillus ferrooxidans]